MTEMFQREIICFWKNCEHVSEGTKKWLSTESKMEGKMVKPLSIPGKQKIVGLHTSQRDEGGPNMQPGQKQEAGKEPSDCIF